MANAAAQNTAARNQRFQDLVASSVEPAPNNYSSEIQGLMSHSQANPDANYAKAGALLVEQRDEVDAFIDWVLFG